MALRSCTFCLIICIISGVAPSGTPAARPNIVFIVADDLGWNDVSWNNAQIKTPHMEWLARQGVILNQTYAQPMCTPSRNAFMTGLYPFHTGLQHFVIRDMAPAGIPLNVTLLPQLLKQAGYATHMIGKWHLGYCSWNYTPTRRGFDSFLGYYTGESSYYSHMTGDPDAFGLDFRNNETAAWSLSGNYSTDLYAERAQRIIRTHATQNEKPLFLYLAFQAAHSPLEVPNRYMDLYKDVADPHRRAYSALVSSMDDAIQNVTAALNQSGLLGNTIVLFTSDNGGAVYFGGSNWPFRGAKATLYEGGTRVPAFAYSPLFETTGYVSNALMHATDWFNTILNFAQVQPEKSVTYPLDGVDQSLTLSRNVSSARHELVYNINEVMKNAAIRVGQYKLIVGYPGTWQDWYPVKQDAVNFMDGFDMLNVQVAGLLERADGVSNSQLAPKLHHELRLYNLETDPLERDNIAPQNMDIVKQLLDRIASHKLTLMPAQNPPGNPDANPKYWGGAWSPGWCSGNSRHSPHFLLILSFLLVLACARLLA